MLDLNFNHQIDEYSPNASSFEIMFFFIAIISTIQNEKKRKKNVNV